MAYFSKLKLYYLLKMHGYPNFLFGYQKHLLSSAFSDSVLVDTTHRKPAYLEMRRTCAQ